MVNTDVSRRCSPSSSKTSRVSLCARRVQRTPKGSVADAATDGSFNRVGGFNQFAYGGCVGFGRSGVRSFVRVRHVIRGGAHHDG